MKCASTVTLLMADKILDALAHARAQVAKLEKQAQARSRELVSLPGRYGFTSPNALFAAILKASRAMTPKLPVRVAKAKPMVEGTTVAGTTAPAASAPKPTKAKGTRTRITPEILASIRRLSEEGRTVSQISDETGVAMNTIFRQRAKMGLKGIKTRLLNAGKAKPRATPKAKSPPKPKVAKRTGPKPSASPTPGTNAPAATAPAKKPTAAAKAAPKAPAKVAKKKGLKKSRGKAKK